MYVKWVSSLSPLFIVLRQANKLHLFNYLCVMAARDINISGAVQEQLSQFQSACRKSESEPVFHCKPEAFDHLNNPDLERIKMDLIPLLSFTVLLHQKLHRNGCILITCELYDLHRKCLCVPCFLVKVS